MKKSINEATPEEWNRVYNESLQVTVKEIPMADKHEIKQSFVFKGKVERVYDGDTLYATLQLGFDIFKYSSIRVSGIDTPELRGSSPAEKVLARKARDRMKKLCGKEIWVESLNGGEADKYGRVLASVYQLDGTDIAAVLIKEGHAVKYDGSKKTHVWV